MSFIVFFSINSLTKSLIRPEKCVIYPLFIHRTHVVEDELRDVFATAVGAFDTEFHIRFLLTASDPITWDDYRLNGGTCRSNSGAAVTDFCISGSDNCGTTWQCQNGPDNLRHCRSAVRLRNRLPTSRDTSLYDIGVVGHVLCLSEGGVCSPVRGVASPSGAPLARQRKSIVTAWEGIQNAAGTAIERWEWGNEVGIATTIQHELTHILADVDDFSCSSEDCVIRNYYIDQWCDNCHRRIRTRFPVN